MPNISPLNIIDPPPHKHFNGWVSIINELKTRFTRQDFIIHPFLDRDVLFFRDKLLQLKQQNWVGFVHFPTHGAPLLHPDINSVNVVKYIDTSEYKEGCKGLIVLTEKARNVLSKITNIPIIRLWHPKYTLNYKFNIDKYFNQPTLRHPGKAYRNFYPFFQIQTSLKKKIHIEPENLPLIHSCLELHGYKVQDFSVKIKTKFLSDKKYIKKLTSSIGFGYYYDCEASNSILEHLMTHTPTIVNRLPSIEEYLGSDYPLYYENVISDLDKFLLDRQFIQDTSNYLKSRSKMPQFSLDYFCDSVNSI